MTGALGGVLGAMGLSGVVGSLFGTSELVSAILAGAIAGGLLGGIGEALRQLLYGEGLDPGKILLAWIAAMTPEAT